MNDRSNQIRAPLVRAGHLDIPDKKSIIDNLLKNEIISIRIDSLLKMIEQKMKNRLPEINEEGATGKFDNKGAIFAPGWLVYHDAGEQSVRYETWKKISGPEFRDRIRSMMRFDNATLLYPDGLASSINLDNGFFSKAARQTLTYKQAAYRRKKSISGNIKNEVSTADIIRIISYM